jgi:circadian clock protein KaiC
MTTRQPPRIATGIPGLDPILEGGLLSGGVYLLQGPPGSGKTILANQLCFHQARNGHRAIYFTLLSDSHAAMFGHLERMAFFGGELVGSAVVYFSGYKVLEEDGIAGLARLIGKTMADRGPSMVVVDGFVTATEAAPAPGELKQFVRQVQTFSASMSCTTLLLSSSHARPAIQPEHTVVDGIIELSDDLNGLRSLRHLQVRKMRGTRQIRGRHTLEITDQGVAVHTRFEVGSEGARHGNSVGTERRAFGVAELDAMMNGGVPAGSITMLLGASGVGKTTLAMQFIAAGAAQGDRGLYFSMYEQPDALLAKSDRLQLGLQPAVDAGTIHLTWERPIEGVLDILAAKMMQQVRELGIKRLAIDGMHSLIRTIDFPERIRAVSAALAEELTALGVTTVYTLESPELIGAAGAAISVPIDDLSAMSHNVLVLRQIECDEIFSRTIAILKMRDSDYDGRVRALRITDRGIVLGRPPRFDPRSANRGRSTLPRTRKPKR